MTSGDIALGLGVVLTTISVVEKVYNAVRGVAVSPVKFNALSEGHSKLQADHVQLAGSVATLANGLTTLQGDLKAVNVEGSGFRRDIDRIERREK